MKPKRIILIRPRGVVTTWFVVVEREDGQYDQTCFNREDDATLKASRLSDEFNVNVLLA